jgi:hypothetical protein
MRRPVARGPRVRGRRIGTRSWRDARFAGHRNRAPGAADRRPPTAAYPAGATPAAYPAGATPAAYPAGATPAAYPAGGKPSAW